MQNDPEPMIQLDQPLPDVDDGTSLDRLDHSIAHLRRLLLGDEADAAAHRTNLNARRSGHLHGHHAESPKGPRS